MSDLGAGCSLWPRLPTLVGMEGNPYAQGSEYDPPAALKPMTTKEVLALKVRRQSAAYADPVPPCGPGGYDGEKERRYSKFLR